MLMRLIFPPVAVVFFAGLLEFVTFDLIPTDVIYAIVFQWVNAPYSDEAENIGYSSVFMIENAGSIPIYILLSLLLQLILTIIRLVSKSGRVHDLAVNQ